MKPNIEAKGRAARGGLALIFLFGGILLVGAAPLFAGIFILVGLFCAFESWVGWCAVRACGVKTPL